MAATRTSVKSGAWSAAGTWDTGVPGDGDDVVISAGHVVTFDVDQSAFTTGVGVTINGTLTHTTASGNYCLFAKTGSSIVGSGIWNIGTSGTPIPFASKHLITGATGWAITTASGLDINIYGAEPSIKYIQLLEAEGIGQTELSIDTDVTGDIWTTNDTVLILDWMINSSTVEQEYYTISSITSTKLNLSSGLTLAKNNNALIILITRNIRIVATGTTALFSGVASGPIVIGGGEITGPTRLSMAASLRISGGIFHNMSYGAYNTTPLSVSNAVFAKIGSVLQGSSGCLTQNSLFFSSDPSAYSGNTRNVFNNCKMLGCNGGVNRGGTGNEYRNCLITPGNYVIGGISTILFNTSILYALYPAHSAIDVRFIRCTFTSSSSHYQSSGMCYNCNYRLNSVSAGYLSDHEGFEQIFDTGSYGYVYNLKGGNVSTTPFGWKPPYYNIGFYYAMSAVDGNFYTLWKKKINVPCGMSLRVHVFLKTDYVAISPPPMVYLMSGNDDPIVGSTPVDSWTMSSALNNWETSYFDLDNSLGLSDFEYTLWFVIKGTNKSASSMYYIEPPLSGGGVSRSRILGGL